MKPVPIGDFVLRPGGCSANSLVRPREVLRELPRTCPIDLQVSTNWNSPRSFEAAGMSRADAGSARVTRRELTLVERTAAAYCGVVSFGVLQWLIGQATLTVSMGVPYEGRG